MKKIAALLVTLVIGVLALAFGSADAGVGVMRATGASQYVPAWTWDAAGTRTIPAGASFARASSATQTDISGALVSVSSNVARFDYDPITHASLGYLAELQSTNSVRNNTMVGAATGTPGTPPTNWTIGGMPAGVSSSIVGVGQINGIDYIDIRYSGTSTGVNGGYAAVFETSSAIASAQGQSWTQSAYLALVGGSFANVTSLALCQVSYPGGIDNVLANLTGSLTSSLVRKSGTLTIPNVGNTNIQPRIVFFVTAGAVDFTLRIGLPQMEGGGVGLTSVIKTTGSTATRAADGLTVPLSSVTGWNGSAGGVVRVAYRLNFLSATTTQVAVSLSDAAGNNTVTIRPNLSGGGTIRGTTANATTGQISVGSRASPAAGVRDKIAFAWSTRGAIARLGNAAETVAGPYLLPATLTSLYPGSFGNANQLNGTIESIALDLGERSGAFARQVSQ